MEEKFNELFGKNNDYWNPDENYYIARGHLAANADFSYKAWQVCNCKKYRTVRNPKPAYFWIAPNPKLSNKFSPCTYVLTYVFK